MKKPEKLIRFGRHSLAVHNCKVQMCRGYLELRHHEHGNIEVLLIILVVDVLRTLANYLQKLILGHLRPAMSTYVF